MFSNSISTGALAVLLAGSQLAAAHIEIQYPPPFRSRFNTNAVNVDYTNTAPLADTGANYPCKGYHSDLGTAAGKSVATFAPGGTYNFTTAGTASHGGGSCQVSLSYDQGKTFTVIQSIIGGCPLSSSYPFTVPADAPAGEAIWAWTWNNQIGNREQYMNCAAVTIGGGSSKRDEAAEAAQVEAPAKRATAAFSSRPQIFLANIGNGCATTEGTDVNYPNPGPDVTTSGSKVGPPVGSCGTSSGGSGAGAGAGNGAGSGSGSGSTPTSSKTAPTTTSKVNLPGGVFVTVAPTTTSTVAPAAKTTLQTSTTKAASNPAPTPGSGSSGSGSSGSGSAGAHAAGSACTNEGAWNCIGGKQWQRCASGLWSAVQPVAPGTVCKAGESSNLDVTAAKVRRRFRGAGKFVLF
ncbi:hypothetical protein C8A05DRAFT_36052 [Staphylotrichum tortipilum]|uniref:Extracellular protein n=1 Tax=Staphylotrichum tortipilum TaxID=2831512 RepID=A0AAN6MGU9_9PEZI|nr:hypothetical protein C8A05DRAFT_36052 [Staphylotrichum longicolle]